MEAKVYRESYDECMLCLPVGADVIGLGVIGEKRITGVGIWDTGATRTVISKRIADELGVELAPLRTSNVRAMQHVRYYGTALVALQIGDIRTPYFWVVVAGLDPDEGDPDFLIGMDVIGSGRLEVDSKNGKTTLTFEI